MAKKVTERELIELEKLEYDYFNHIKFYLLNNRDRMKRALESKNKIRDDWFEQFVIKREGTSGSDVGIKRIFYWLEYSMPWNLCDVINGKIVVYETWNAFIIIHIGKNIKRFCSSTQKPILNYRIDSSLNSKQIALSLIKNDIPIFTENIKLRS